ncbi:MAG: hypothetical protein IJ837_03310 [Clostridia bacterium]|nr:hypothetical protein [Clostridia bacterium]
MIKFDFLNKFKWFQKLKSIKHIKLILVLFLTVLIIFIYFYDFKSTSKTSKNVTQTSGSSSTSVYAKELEQRLENTLSKISGAGEVKVMITFNGVTELVLANQKDEKTTSTKNSTSSGTNESETTTVSTEPILITENGATNPIVLMEILPEIKGVIVVAQGADNIRVKLDLLKAVQALLLVESNQVEIFKGN